MKPARTKALKNANLIGCGVLILLAALFEYGFDRLIISAKYNTRDKSCRQNLRDIGTRLTQYKQQQGHMPESLVSIQKYDGDGVLRCPLAFYADANDYNKSDYLYRCLLKPRKEDIICWDRVPHHPASIFLMRGADCRNVLLANGAVQTISEEEFSKMRLTGVSLQIYPKRLQTDLMHCASGRTLGGTLFNKAH